jgi:hypothetical protein
MARYETYSVLQRLIETDNARWFHRQPFKATARFLREHWGDSFVQSDPVLSRLNPRRIQYLALAACLAVGGTAEVLDDFCSI